MEFDQVLYHLTQRYANCKTYRDSGRVDGGLGSMAFNTYFVRPSKFRFDWIYLDEGSARNCIWTDGVSVFASYASEESAEEESDLSLAIAGATGVSQGTAHSIPTLLLPDIRASIESFTILKQFSSNTSWENDIHNGVNCYKAKSLGRNGNDELWIRSTDLAIIKLREEYTSTPEDDEITINSMRDYDPTEVVEMRRYLESQTAEERHSVSIALYEDVIFDEDINDAVFNNPFI